MLHRILRHLPLCLPNDLVQTQVPPALPPTPDSAAVPHLVSILHHHRADLRLSLAGLAALRLVAPQAYPTRLGPVLGELLALHQAISPRMVALYCLMRPAIPTPATLPEMRALCQAMHGSFGDPSAYAALCRAGRHVAADAPPEARGLFVTQLARGLHAAARTPIQISPPSTNQAADGADVLLTASRPPLARSQSAAAFVSPPTSKSSHEGEPGGGGLAGEGADNSSEGESLSAQEDDSMWSLAVEDEDASPARTETGEAGTETAPTRQRRCPTPPRQPTGPWAGRVKMVARWVAAMRRMTPPGEGSGLANPLVSPTPDEIFAPPRVLALLSYALARLASPASISTAAGGGAAAGAAAAAGGAAVPPTDLAGAAERICRLKEADQILVTPGDRRWVRRAARGGASQAADRMAGVQARLRLLRLCARMEEALTGRGPFVCAWRFLCTAPAGPPPDEDLSGAELALAQQVLHAHAAYAKVSRPPRGRPAAPPSASRHMRSESDLGPLTASPGASTAGATGGVTGPTATTGAPPPVGSSPTEGLAAGLTDAQRCVLARVVMANLAGLLVEGELHRHAGRLVPLCAAVVGQPGLGTDVQRMALALLTGLAGDGGDGDGTGLPVAALLLALCRLAAPHATTAATPLSTPTTWSLLPAVPSASRYLATASGLSLPTASFAALVAVLYPGAEPLTSLPQHPFHRMTISDRLPTVPARTDKAKTVNREAVVRLHAAEGGAGAGAGVGAFNVRIVTRETTSAEFPVVKVFADHPSLLRAAPCRPFGAVPAPTQIAAIYNSPGPASPLLNSALRPSPQPSPTLLASPAPPGALEAGEAVAEASRAVWPSTVGWYLLWLMVQDASGALRLRSDGLLATVGAALMRQADDPNAVRVGLAVVARLLDLLASDMPLGLLPTVARLLDRHQAASPDAPLHQQGCDLITAMVLALAHTHPPRAIPGLGGNGAQAAAAAGGEDGGALAGIRGLVERSMPLLLRCLAQAASPDVAPPAAPAPPAVNPL
ncbi:hypothetical protein PAPYR_6418 [Paratrimastix pyriformis]|uniref:Uncharacterized protein n=1 Tax=Paratrimastix pyriformis TaxID=342808 RepID=A0ABQ8UHW0_9EUKA|nr:hypothetical protein PAPYR_6418 [Paratrimastix pyriformis]